MVLAIGTKIALVESVSPAPVMLQDMTVTQLLGHYSSIYGIPQATLAHTISCESSFNRYAHHVGPKENDYGLVQINLLAWKNISIQQAEEPQFAISFLAKNIKAGDASSMWVTCYNKNVV